LGYRHKKGIGLLVDQYFNSVTDSEDNPPVLFWVFWEDEELITRFAGLEVEFVIAASTDSEDNPPVLFVMVVSFN
jgi:hypothetical protein